MSKIIDPDQLNQSTEVVISTAAKTVQLLAAGNLNNIAPGSTSGVTLQALYSFLKEEWLSDDALNKFTFPLKAFTKNEFQWINGWSPADATTRTLVRDAGWAETVGSEDGDLYSGFISLGNFDADTDQGYYQQVTGFDQNTTNFDKTGNVNEAVLVYDASGGPADYTDFFKAFLRIQGKTHSSYDLLTEQGIPVLESTLYRFPLANGTDLDLNASDAVIDASMTVTFTNATDLVNATSHDWTAGDKVVFSTDTTLPAEITAGTVYYVINANTDDFQISTESGGTALAFTDDGTGVHTATSAPYGGMSVDYLTGNHDTAKVWSIGLTIASGDIIFNSSGRYFRATSSGTTAVDDSDLAGGSDTGVTWEVDPGERQIGSTYYHFSRILDINDGTRYESYEWGQRQLRKTSDINADTNGDTFGTVNGNVADEFFAFRGSDLIMEQGVWLDNLPLSEKNNVAFVPHDVTGVSPGEQTFPFVAILTFTFSANIVGASDVDTRAVVYFTNDDAGDNAGNDFDTSGAIIVDDNSSLDMDFQVDAASIEKDYDYDGNIQRGAASAGVDAPCTLQMVGIGDYENITVGFTIPQGNVAINVSAADERNYSNPA